MHYTKEMLKVYTNDYGDVDLSESDVSSLPDDLTISGDLSLELTEITSLPENLTVGGSLILELTEITSLPENLTVGGSLLLAGTQITSLPENLKVGGYLDLYGTNIKSLPEGLQVGGDLLLRNTSIETLPKGLKVGGSLYLSHTKITALPEGLKVGDSLYHDYLTLSDNQRLHNGDYVPNEYIYVDGRLTHIKREKKIGNYTYYIGVFPDRNVIYDGSYYAHCEDLRTGIQDLAFKHAEDRGADQYAGLTLNSVVSRDVAITMYRIITGACQQGTNMFVDSLKEVKEEYTVQEIIDLIKGQYNSDVFAKFFE